MKTLDIDVIVGQTELGNDLRDTVKDYELRNLARLQLALDDRVEELSKIVTNLRQLYDFVRMSRIPEVMAEQGDIKTVSFEGVGRVTVVADMYVSLPADVKAAAYSWFVDKGFSDLITETVNASTLKAWTSRRVKAGDEVPEFIKVTPYQRAQITRA